ncbi:MAG: sigma-54 interaction domain-containing protein, partial [Candidatus Binatia bacterium]
ELHAAAQEAAHRNEPREALLSGGPSERLGKVVIEPFQRQGEAAGALLYFPSPQMPTRVELRRVGESVRWAARYTFADLLGTAPHFRVALQRAQRVAPTDLPVFLQGETGTGKELLAHAIHHASPRGDGPFVAVNCGALAPDLIAAELFGYEKGAFTGAVTSGKRGKLELAHGGTIFLDEITDTSPTLQISLLRALQDQEIVPVGGEYPTRIDVRVIAASNRNVHALIQQGVFRSDLYYRLNGVTIILPPLRERQEDIPLLAQHFLREARVEKPLSADARTALQQYQWPGNLRELRAVLQAAAVLAPGAVIQVADLPPEVCAASGRTLYTPTESGEPQSVRAVRETANGRQVKELAREALLAALRAHHGNAKQAAKELGIARSSLYRKLSEFGLTRAWAQHEKGRS